ncbi:MAG: YkgJ family cysteine cluster protein [Candidatus Aenigmarchaeota archaeon]|nr:YkgJ family cysteine cluster protein [Candidatus Aenigmarchaeota archaeon]MCX8179389.1 YkgJ family cysteine cluster protein [Candidatus Aenigmarchaeota archaeon]
MNICQKCRSCCKFKKEHEYFAPVFTKEEVKRINADKNLFKIKGHGVYQIKLVPSKFDKEILVCPFLDEDTHLCKIYDKRPFDCKFWPFIFMKDKDKIQLGCFKKDYCMITENMSEKQYQIYLNSIFDWIQSNKIMKLIKKYPDLIWEKEEDVVVLKEFSSDSLV